MTQSYSGALGSPPWKDPTPPNPKKNFALFGAIGIAISAILLGLSASSKSWFVFPEGEGARTISGGVGPVFAEICRKGECESELLIKNAKNDMAIWSMLGLAFAGAVATLMIWFIVTFILGMMKHRANRILGWVVLAFTGITLINGLAFFAMKPDKMMLETGSGVIFMVLGSLLAIGSCVMSSLGAPPKVKPAPFGAQPPMPMGPPPSHVPQMQQMQQQPAGYGPASA